MMFLQQFIYDIANFLSARKCLQYQPFCHIYGFTEYLNAEKVVADVSNVCNPGLEEFKFLTKLNTALFFISDTVVASGPRQRHYYEHTKFSSAKGDKGNGWRLCVPSCQHRRVQRK